MWKHKKGLEPPIREKVSLVKIVFRLFFRGFFSGYETTILENNSICVPNFVHSIYRKGSLKCFHSIYRKGSLSCFLFHFWDFFVGVFLPCGVKQVNLPLLDKWLVIAVRNVRFSPSVLFCFIFWEDSVNICLELKFNWIRSFVCQKQKIMITLHSHGPHDSKFQISKRRKKSTKFHCNGKPKDEKSSVLTQIVILFALKLYSI